MKNSVALTTYNGEKYIEKQLDSIRNQTLPPDEVIIRDDCSIDKTPDIVKEYITRYSLNWDFRVNESNRGFFDNFFEAIRACTGDVVYLADQDDVWDLRKIETFTTLYQSQTIASMIQSNYIFIDGQGKTLRKKELYHGKPGSENVNTLSTLDMFKCEGSGYTMSFRKEVADVIFANRLDKKKDVYIYHDLLIGQAAAVVGNCYLLSKIVDSHRLHSDNETQKKGRSFLANRTKKVQLDILHNRVEQCKLWNEIVKETKKKAEIDKMRAFSNDRYRFIETKKISLLNSLIKRKDLYSSKKGLVTDIMYAFGLEKVLVFILSHM